MIGPFRGALPQIAASAFVHPAAVIIGDVVVGAHSSIWPGVVVRGDVAPIRIGERTNIQDNATVHGRTGGPPTVIGNGVTVGHAAVVHACVVEDDVLVGIGAIVLDLARIASRSIVGAGALVSQGKTFPPGSLLLGRPAQVTRPLTDEEVATIADLARRYESLSREYLLEYPMATHARGTAEQEGARS
ncbi:MAG: gamma carbonic anhydrase family protein [Candidatus Schekmanbacteria bacterium]|nr:gamma carbonic anhydrase family protein [Candidatus Schekmanbacteria bacterium]